MKLGRRHVIAGGTAGFAMSAARAVTFDSSDPGETLPAFARLTGNIGGGTVLRWHTGVITAVMPGAAPVPLVAYDGLEKEIWIANADGTFTTTYFDIGYFKDAVSGAHLSAWLNPMTGTTTTPMAFRSGKYAATLKPADFKREIDVRDDDISFTNRSTVAFPAPMKPDVYPDESAGPLHFFSVIRSDRGRVSEVSSSTVRSAPLAWSYTITTVWLPWMKMGQRPGAVVWTGAGGKYRGPDQVPGSFKAFLDREQPNYLADGEPWADVRNMWGDYMKAHPPSKG